MLREESVARALEGCSSSNAVDVCEEEAAIEVAEV